MVFKLEAEMVMPVKNWMAKQGFMVKAEFATPWGICDLVGAKFNKNKVARRIAYGQRKSIGSLSKAILLNNIPDIDDNSPITTTKLCKLLEDYYPTEKIHADLDQLLKNKFIKSPMINYYHKLNGWMPIQKRLVTVELKLNRIQEALHQAYNHCLFADESYVALPHDTAKRIISGKKKDDFIMQGVGLIGAKKDGCEILIKSALSGDKIDRIIQSYLVDRFWMNYLRGNSA